MTYLHCAMTTEAVRLADQLVEVGPIASAELAAVTSRRRALIGGGADPGPEQRP